jgi:molybdate transport system permease protein
VTRRPATPLPWLGGLLALYLAVPLVAFAVRLAGSGQRGFGTPGLLGALYVSVATATISTALVAVFGVPLAYLLARSPGPIGTVLGVVVQLPLAMPPLMSGILLVELVGPYTTLGRAFGRHLTDSMAGVVLAQTFVSSPFLVVAARSAFASVDRSLVEHAATLGHREWARFWRVSLPLAGPGIRAGLVLSWLRAFGEYGATVVLAYHPYTLPVYTYVQFSGTGIPTTQAPTALGLLVAAAVATLGRVPRPRRRRTTTPRLPAPVPPQVASPTPVACRLDARLGTFRLDISYRANSARLAVLGPSGSGKSAMLRGIAGLLGPGVGSVSYGNRDVSGIAVEDRRIGYVPQGYGLLPHLTVWEQVCFGVGADPGLAAHWLARLHLNGLNGRFPAELSGGQRQRVALAQSLARAPDLLLLDEPFSALDAPVRHELRAELRRLHREAGLSTVLVTHDPEEAAFLADEVIVLSAGRVLQSGAKRDVFAAPASPEVARLIGYHNLCTGRVHGPGQVETGGALIAMDTGPAAPGAAVLWSIRPEQISLDPGGRYAATIIDTADLGSVTDVLLRVGTDVELEVRVPHSEAREPGSSCRVTLPVERIRVWPTGTDPAGGARPRRDSENALNDPGG